MARLGTATDALLLENSFDRNYEMWSFTKRMMRRLEMMKKIPDRLPSEIFQLGITLHSLLVLVLVLPHRQMEVRSFLSTMGHRGFLKLHVGMVHGV